MPQNDFKTILEEAKLHFIFSGAQLYAKSPSKLVALEIGQTSYWPGSLPVKPDTYFDIGSVTKAVATTSILARLFERGEFGLERPLVESLPSLKGTKYGALTPQSILTHGAGFLDWYPVFKETAPHQLLDWFLKSEDQVLVSGVGEKVLYSDLGFLFLWEVLKEKQGPIETLFQTEVVEPLGLREVRFGPVVGGVASTEYDEAKKNVWTGTVFDENARWLGGKAPHAGLFSTARGLSPWCEAWLDAWHGRSSWLKRETALEFTQNYKGRGIGFDLKSEKGSSAGTRMGAKTLGHLGFTGCSVWIDPEKEMYVILLTNRVHPLRVDERIRSLRPILHDAVIEFLEGA